jgi:predicted nucleotidyltransferase
MEINPTLETLRHVLEPYGSELVCAYLFGSLARGEAKSGSDVDVAVLFHAEPPATLDGLGLTLTAHIEAATGRRADIVVLNRASPDLIHRVLRDGILLLETDRTARIHFEVKARAAYFDVLPYLQEYRRATDSRHDRP